MSLTPKSNTTLKQELTFRELVQALDKKEPIKLNQLMLRAGYTKATAHNPEKNLTSRLGWQTLLATIDDKPLLDKLWAIALSEDKKAGLNAIRTLLIDLKGYGAEKKYKITQYEQNLKNLLVEKEE